MNRTYYSSALSSFTITITLFLILRDRVLVVYLPDNVITIIIQILVGVGVFTFIYRYLLKMILFFTRIMSPFRYLNGNWYQIFTFYNDKYLNVRYGPVQLRMSDDKLLISATSYRLDDIDSFSSSWLTTSCIIHSNRLTFLFESRGKRALTQGIMVYTIEGSPPKRLVGNFNDVAPSSSHGNITLFNSKDEYETELSKYTEIVKKQTECLG